MYQRVHVQVVQHFPLAAQGTNAWTRFLAVILVQQFLQPFRMLLFPFAFDNDLVDDLGIDAPLLVQLAELDQRQRNFIAKNGRSLLGAFRKIQVLVSVQGIVVNKVFEWSLRRKVVLNLM